MSEHSPLFASEDMEGLEQTGAITTLPPEAQGQLFDANEYTVIDPTQVSPEALVDALTETPSEHAKQGDGGRQMTLDEAIAANTPERTVPASIDVLSDEEWDRRVREDAEERGKPWR